MHLDASPNVVTAAAALRPAALSPASTEAMTAGTDVLTPIRAYADAAKEKKGKPICSKPVSSELRKPTPKEDRSDEEGFTKVERKRRPTRRNQCGTAPTGPDFPLRPATPTTQLYVSRLHHSTKVEEIVEYVRLKTKFKLRVERLEARHNVNFNSFVVRVPTHHLSTFMKAEFWPKNFFVFAK